MNNYTHQQMSEAHLKLAQLSFHLLLSSLHACSHGFQAGLEGLGRTASCDPGATLQPVVSHRQDCIQLMQQVRFDGTSSSLRLQF